MRVKGGQAGFALLLVLWTLVIVSTIALTLAASVGTEAQAGQDSWSSLQAERLASSGQEIAAYLETRAIGTSSENLTGLPVEPLVAGLRYRVKVSGGYVDLLLEGENGRLDVATADSDLATSFFTQWTGDVLRGREIVDSIADWKDADDEPRPLGGESGWYSGRGYMPRNSGLGAADLFLIKGFLPEDSVSVLKESVGRVSIRNPLPWVVASMPTGRGINPNYASRLVLQSIPGIGPEILNSILEMRKRSIFKNIDEFRSELGLNPDSTVLKYVTFDRGATPTVLATAHLENSKQVRNERRKRFKSLQNRFVWIADRSVLDESQ